MTYNFHLSWEEFEELTPHMLQALCKQRNIRIKYERFAHGLTASAVYNVNISPEAARVRAFDFVMTEEQAEKRDTRLNALKYITQQISGMPIKTPRSKFLEVRRGVIKTLEANGIKDAEQMVNEKFPSLKPKEDEQ